MVDIDSAPEPITYTDENDPSLTPAQRRELRWEHARRNFGRDRYNPEAARSIPTFRESLRNLMRGVYRRTVPAAQDDEKKAA